MLKEHAGAPFIVALSDQLNVEEGELEALHDNVVRFRALEDAEIQQYVDTGEPYDKAGGYAIQGRAAVFIPEILGSYTGVMGLPLYETAALLRKFQGRA